MTKKLKVGVVGCGLVAQIMHLHYLHELRELYEVVAICDLSEPVRAGCAATYGISETYSDWRQMLARPLDAIFVLSSGSHAPIAIAAAEVGVHVFVEKPMCFSVVEGQAMIAAAKAAKVTLMVAYNKRYDAAYRRFSEEYKRLDDLRLVKITTLELPIDPYVRQYPIQKGGSLPTDLVQELTADNNRRVVAAIGDVTQFLKKTYHLVLLDSMVHEFNAIRGVMGEPDRLEFADIQEHGITMVLQFDKTQCVISWVDLPGIARYEMNFSMYSPMRRLTLSFPSPFVRNLPTTLSIEDGDTKSGRAWSTDEITSFSESFKEELVHFHECVTTGRTPITSAEDGLRDIALCEAVILSHRTRTHVEMPTMFERRGAVL